MKLFFIITGFAWFLLGCYWERINYIPAIKPKKTNRILTTKDKINVSDLKPGEIIHLDPVFNNVLIISKNGDMTMAEPGDRVRIVGDRFFELARSPTEGD